MNSEERFKKSLEDLLASKDFAFDEGNWDKARKMIDASKRQRRMAPYILAAILLVGSLLTGFYFLSNAPSTTDKKIAITENKEMKSPVVSTTPELNSETKPQAMPAPAPASVQKPATKPTPVSVKEQPTTKSINVPGNNGITVPATSSPEKIVPEKIKNITPKNPVLSSAVTPLANTPPAAQPITVPETKTKAVTPENLAAVEPVVNSDKNEKFIEPANKNNSPAPDKISKESSELSIEKTKAPDEYFASDVTPPLNNSTHPAVPETKSGDLQLNPIPPQTTVPAGSTIPLALTDSVKNNSSQIQETLPPDNDQGELGRPKEHLTLFSVEAGANYMFGWKTPGAPDARGFNPVAGINYFNNFKPKMSVSVGLQYASVGNLSYGNYTSKVTRFGFGEETKVSIFTPVKVHYLIVPLRFNYSINTLNTVGIGCNVAYLLNVEGQVETYTEKLNTKYDESVTKTKGYMEGFKKYNAQISVFYKRTLYKNLAVNFEAFYGLTDVKDNRFFNSNVVERNSGLKLTLVYNFFKK